MREQYKMRIVIDRFTSKAFGIKMGNIEYEDSSHSISPDDIDKIISEAIAEGFSHLSLKIDFKEDRLKNFLLNRGFYLAGSQVMYQVNLDNIPEDDGLFQKPPHPLVFREIVGEEDILDIVRISRTAFKRDRFHSDPFLSPDKADVFYANWARSCCEGLSDKVFVLSTPDSGVIGYITISLDKGQAKVGLAAVDSKFRERGMFTLMISQTLYALKLLNIHDFYYGTQGTNTPVIKVMEKLNGEVYSCNHVLHFRCQQ